MMMITWVFLDPSPNYSDANISYTESTDEQNNLYGFVDFQLYPSAYIRCKPVIVWQFVQFQNNILVGYNFHSAEVEVYGYEDWNWRNPSFDDQ